jgi:hypothetical protein
MALVNSAALGAFILRFPARLGFWLFPAAFPPASACYPPGSLSIRICSKKQGILPGIIKLYSQKL